MGKVLRPAWLDWPQVGRITGLCESAGIPFCFVGGAVRDALAAAKPHDFDICMGCAPDVTEKLLREQNIAFERVVSRNMIRRAGVGGLQFDFIHVPGALALPFEETVAAFTSQADFTINGMALFPSGLLYDRAGGQKDLAAGRIRFLGDSEAKIASQPHRPLPLRFFRLLACFGKGKPDQETLEACVRLAPLLRDIAYRGVVMRELYKLLNTPHPQKAIALMHEHGVWPHVLGVPLVDTESFETLAAVERLQGDASHWLVRMALLLLSADVQEEEKALAQVAGYLDMPAHERKALEHLLDYYASVDVPLPEWEQNDLTKRLGREGLKNLLWLAWVFEEDVEAAAEKYQEALATVS